PISSQTISLVTAPFYPDRRRGRSPNPSPPGEAPDRTPPPPPPPAALTLVRPRRNLAGQPRDPP
ncbi:MAG TPA: hypothetical protein VGB57_04045, partial [Allosphingosinicella sp.]